MGDKRERETHPLFFDGLKQKLRKIVKGYSYIFHLLFFPVPVTCFMLVFGANMRDHYSFFFLFSSPMTQKKKGSCNCGT